MSTNFTTTISDLKNDAFDIYQGKIKGFTSGFAGIDELAGRMETGQIWTVTGYTGTGKSFFALNMIEGILAEWRNQHSKFLTEPKIMVLSTELSTKVYTHRQILLRLGMYELTFVRSIRDRLEDYNATATDFLAERMLNPDTLNIFGEVQSIEQVEMLIKTHQPNIVFIDYLQELSAKKSSDLKETMPFIAQELKRMAQQWHCVIVAISQINNYALKEDIASQVLLPMANGRELGNASHTVMMLVRERVNGELTNVLRVCILKARNGQSKPVSFEILDGYKLKPAPL